MFSRLVDHVEPPVATLGEKRARKNFDFEQPFTLFEKKLVAIDVKVHMT